MKASMTAAPFHRRATCVLAAAVAFSIPPLAATAAPVAADATSGAHLVQASFGDYRPSAAARNIADWVRRSGDNGGTSFVIVDKPHAHVLVFDADARLQGHAPVLLGLARGDDSVPGIGERKLADITPEERTTPAGRFVAEVGRNLRDEDVVWIDYDAAVDMHRVLTSNPRERRAQRLATTTIADNRISYGCVNVPAAFFETRLLPAFKDGRQHVIYVLPDVKTLEQAFPQYRPAAPGGVAAGQGGRAARVASVGRGSVTR